MKEPPIYIKLIYMLRLCYIYVWFIASKVVLIWKGEYNWMRNRSFFAPQLLRIIVFKGKAFINDSWIVWRTYIPDYGYVLCDPWIARSNRGVHDICRKPPARRVRRI